MSEPILVSDRETDMEYVFIIHIIYLIIYIIQDKETYNVHNTLKVGPSCKNEQYGCMETVF